MLLDNYPTAFVDVWDPCACGRSVFVGVDLSGCQAIAASWINKAGRRMAFPGPMPTRRLEEGDDKQKLKWHTNG